MFFNHYYQNKILDEANLSKESNIDQEKTAEVDENIETVENIEIPANTEVMENKTTQIVEENNEVIIVCFICKVVINNLAEYKFL